MVDEIQAPDSRSRLGWSIKRLAHALDVSAPFLRREVQRGNLGALRVGDGRRILIPHSEVERYLRERV